MEGKDKFEPRVGKYTFPCKYCGKEPMQWTEIAPDTWMPFDLEDRKVHKCWGETSRKVENMNATIHVTDELHRLRYTACRPRSSTWHIAYATQNEHQAIIFLFRNHGIDLKIYDSPQPLRTDEKGELYTSGGVLIRNNFGKHDWMMANWILDIASRFSTNTPIDIWKISGDERPWAVEKARSIRNYYPSNNDEANRELRDIYDAISVGDGEDAYLGDGVWIGSDGSWSDRGR